jgi:hypothetical protein
MTIKGFRDGWSQHIMPFMIAERGEDDNREGSVNVNCLEPGWGVP